MANEDYYYYYYHRSWMWCLCGVCVTWIGSNECIHACMYMYVGCGRDGGGGPVVVKTRDSSKRDSYVHVCRCVSHSKPNNNDWYYDSEVPKIVNLHTLLLPPYPLHLPLSLSLKFTISILFYVPSPSTPPPSINLNRIYVVMMMRVNTVESRARQGKAKTDVHVHALGCGGV
jgi:hypothetical protein